MKIIFSKDEFRNKSINNINKIWERFSSSMNGKIIIWEKENEKINVFKMFILEY